MRIIKAATHWWIFIGTNHSICWERKGTHRGLYWNRPLHNPGSRKLVTLIRY